MPDENGNILNGDPAPGVRYKVAAVVKQVTDEHGQHVRFQYELIPDRHRTHIMHTQMKHSGALRLFKNGQSFITISQSKVEKKNNEMDSCNTTIECYERVMEAEWNSFRLFGIHVGTDTRGKGQFRDLLLKTSSAMSTVGYSKERRIIDIIR